MEYSNLKNIVTFQQAGVSKQSCVERPNLNKILKYIYT